MKQLIALLFIFMISNATAMSRNEKKQTEKLINTILSEPDSSKTYYTEQFRPTLELLQIMQYAEETKATEDTKTIDSEKIITILFKEWKCITANTLNRLCSLRNESQQKFAAQILSYCLYATEDHERRQLMLTQFKRRQSTPTSSSFNTTLLGVAISAKNFFCTRVLLESNKGTEKPISWITPDPNPDNAPPNLHPALIPVFKLLIDYNVKQIYPENCETLFYKAYKDYLHTIFREQTTYFSYLPSDLHTELLKFNGAILD